MADFMPCSIQDRQRESFTLNGDGDVARRVVGESVPTGVKNGGKITEVILNDSTWTALPTTALVPRSGVAVQNESGVRIKINYINTEPGFVGWSVKDNQEKFYPLAQGVIIYGKSESGNVTITVEEIG